ncbi:hypothetical protein F5X96DRAFT_611967 [Biscogniauxia mediterranea]|nr:hypothetical protein F5X96DRAFT_611967 [Biscogniauxia mediterranea]
MKDTTTTTTTTTVNHPPPIHFIPSPSFLPLPYTNIYSHTHIYKCIITIIIIIIIIIRMPHPISPPYQSNHCSSNQRVVTHNHILFSINFQCISQSKTFVVSSFSFFFAFKTSASPLLLSFPLMIEEQRETRE